jgi:hypothetical protein
MSTHEGAHDLVVTCELLIDEPGVHGPFSLENAEVLTSVLRDGGLRDVTVQAMSRRCVQVRWMNGGSACLSSGVHSRSHRAAWCPVRSRRERRARQADGRDGCGPRSGRDRVRGLGPDRLRAQTGNLTAGSITPLASGSRSARAPQHGSAQGALAGPLARRAPPRSSPARARASE